MRTIKVGGGSGFYGDLADPAIAMAQRTDGLRYIGFDCLSEVTLAILEKQRRRDPRRGFTRDIYGLMPRLLPIARQRGIRIVTNAGGMNPQGARDAIAEMASAAGLRGMTIAVVTGDDLRDRATEVLASTDGLPKITNGRPDFLRRRALSVNAYLGADVVKRALATGADVVVTGRVTDSALFLGPLLFEFGWSADDWDRIAGGIVCGHLLECAGQVVGGNFAGGWRTVEGLEQIGYPVAEVSEDGTFVLTKTPGSGGCVSFDTVREQLLYEVHDPAHYLTPDVDADFSGVVLDDLGLDRVRVGGARGRQKPESLKVCITYEDGWLGEAQIIYSWPDALPKAERAAEILRRRLAKVGFSSSDLRFDFVGYNALHGALSPRPSDPNEIVLRVAARTETEREAERIFRELVPLALNGPPTGAGVGAGRAHARELLGVWSTLVPREMVERDVRVETTTVS